MISNRVKRAYLNTKDGEHQVGIAKYDDLGIDDLLEPLERLDNTTEFNAKETHDVLLCNKICFQEGYSLYNVVDNDIKKKVVSALTKNFGFFLKFVTSMENGQYLELLYSLVYDHPDILQNHYNNIVGDTKKKPLLSELKSIYFGSKLFNKLVEYYKCDMKNYIENLYTLYLGLAKGKPSSFNGELLLSIISLSPSLAIDICFLNSNDQNISMPSLFSSEEIFQETFIKNIFEPANTITKKKLIYQVGLLFDKIGSKENYCTMQYILKSINLQFLDIDKVISNCTNEYFLTAFLNSCNTGMVKRILFFIVMKWTVLGENSGSESNDMLLTKLILQCCNILKGVDFEKEFAHKTFFINGVSKRLMNPMKGFVERTMIVSKRLTNDKIDFEADSKVELLDVNLLDKELKFETLTYLSQGDVSFSLPKKMEELSVTSNEVVKPKLTDDVNKRIYFIKDFIKQLLSISSQSSNDLNVVEVLNEGCKIMEMKIENGNSKEIDFYMSDLLPLLISIKPRTETEEKLPIENFRIRTLVSTIKSNPKTAFEILLDYLFNKDLSIQTRLSLLTSVGLGCLEINESKSLKIDEKVESEIDEMLLHDKLIKHSITTWRSKKLDKNSDNKSDLKTRYFKQQNTVETLKVCHALVNGWINGINLGPTYDKIFKEHYLKLLVFVYGIISEQKHLDANSELKNEVQKVIVDGYSQGIHLEKDLLAEMV